MPKRGVIAIVLTTGALVLLLSFKTPTAMDPVGGTDGAVAIAAGRSPAAAIASPTVTEAPTATIAPSPSAAGDAGGDPVSTDTPVPTDAPASVTSDATLVGQPVSFEFGTVQVQVTIAGGRITDVTALQLPAGDPRSSQISQYAEPYLRESALQAQSAAVDIVSGATYTSQAYAQSLQSALDQTSGQG